MNKPLSITQFLRDYGTEEACESYLSFKRWPDNIYCPFCGCEKIYIHNCQRGGYKCAKCTRKFTVKVNTLFHSSHIPLKTWFFLIYLKCLNKKNISSHQIALNIGVTQKTAWDITRKIRELYWQENITLSGIVEIDEVFLAAGKRWTRWGNTTTRKEPILGLLERGGKVVIQCIPDRSESSIDKIVKHYVQEGSTIYTDGWMGYRNLLQSYDHHYIDHGAREYTRKMANDLIHTNNIENVWRQLKTNIRGAHHSVSASHAQAYCDEVAYRINNRDKKPNEKFNQLLDRAILRKPIKAVNEILKVA